MERKLNAEQMEELRKRRELERSIKIQEERGQMERSRRIAEEEERLRLEHKDAQRRAMARVVEENERNKAIREKQKLVDAEYEAKLNREYLERMEREERARVEAFNARIEALQRSSKRFEMGAGAEIKEKSDREHERTLAAVEKEIREREQREQEEREKRRLESLRSKEANLRLIEHKRQEQQREREELANIRRADEAAAAALKRAELEAKKSRRDRMHEFRKQLDDQVRLREEVSKNEQVLSPVENLLNRSLVGLAAKDPELLNRVIGKVSPTPRNQPRHASTFSLG